MCNADLTIEHAELVRRGQPRFGGSHQCVNWDEVFAWTVDRQQTWIKQHGGSANLSHVLTENDTCGLDYQT